MNVEKPSSPANSTPDLAAIPVRKTRLEVTEPPRHEVPGPRSQVSSPFLLHVTLGIDAPTL